MDSVMIRSVHLALVGVLAAFYLLIAWLAFNPDTEPVYRLYYIDRLIPRWPGEDGLKYALGTHVEGKHLGRNPAAVYLDIDEAIPGGLIRMEASVTVANPATGPIPVAVLVNGHQAASTTIAHSSEPVGLTVEFPATHLAQGINEVILEAPDARLHGMRLMAQDTQ